MQRFIQIILNITLCVCIMLSGSPLDLMIQTAHANSEPNNSSEERPESKTPEEEAARIEAEAATADQEHADAIEELKNAFTAEGRAEAQLDPFLLTRQVVVDDRSDKLEAVTEQAKIDDYLERIDYFEDQIKQYQQLETETQRRLSLVTDTQSESYIELTQILADIQSRIQISQLELDDVKAFDPRNNNPLPVDLMIDEELSTRRYLGRKMRLVLTSNNDPINTLRQETYTQSLSPHKSITGVSYTPEDNVLFRITDKKGRVLHQFLNPISSVLFYGQNIIFTEVPSPGETNVKVRFINLDYFRSNVGNAPLPVFTMPLDSSNGDRTLKIENGHLYVGQDRVNYQQLSMLSYTQQIIFNVSVALADPNAYENALPLLQETLRYFEQSMKDTGKSFDSQISNSLNADTYIKSLISNLASQPRPNPEATTELLDSALKDGKISDTEHAAIKTQLGSFSQSLEANLGLASGKSFMNRMNLLMRYLMHPRPEGAPKLFNALVMIVAPKDETSRSRALDFAKNSFVYKLAKYGAAVGGVYLAGTLLPEPYTIDLYKGLDLISATSQHFMGYLEHIKYGKAYNDLSQDAFITSTTGFTYMHSSYLSEGKWAPFLSGLGSILLIPLKVFASIHFTLNTYKAVRGTFEVRSISGGQLSFLESFKAAARLEQINYWSKAADAEKKVSGSDIEKITPELATLLNDHLDRIRQGRDGIRAVERDLRKGKYGTHTGLHNLVDALGGFAKKLSFGNKISIVFSDLVSKLNIRGGEDSLRSAMLNSYFSYSSLTYIFKPIALFWNYLFLPRVFWLSPSKYFLFALYPDYFKAAVASVPKQQHFPSQYNGGLKLWTEKWRLYLSTLAHSTFSEAKISQIGNILVSPENLARLRAFEKNVIGIERAAMSMAQDKAQIALIENIKDPERLAIIFDSASQPGTVSTGIRNLNDKKLKTLTNYERAFYRAYFTRTFDTIMQKMMTDISSSKLLSDLDPKDYGRTFRQELIRGNIEPELLSPEQFEALKAEIKENLDEEAIRRWSEDTAKSWSGTLERFTLNLRHKALATYHPANGPVRRFMTVQEKVNDTRAMDRAVRMEVTNLVSGIPIGIISSLALYAGVQTGMLMPFDPNGLNTETHYNYFSRQMFYAGWIPGLIFGIMTGTWMKLQEDSRIAEIGGFDKVIKHSDGKKGFWRFYFKNFFKNPNNKWVSNHTFYLKLITANIPAAIITTASMDLIGLQRLEVGNFLTSYLMIYATAFMGMNIKMDQAFELASTWMYNRVPRALRAHPSAQKYINMAIQKHKIWYGYVDNLWSIVIYENIAGAMLTRKDSSEYGTRAFERLIWGGDTFAQIANRILDSMSSTLQKIPGATSVIDGLQMLISNNYEAFERYPDRIPKIPGVEQVIENPNLPKNALAELLGKGLGFIASWGPVFASPYIFTDWLQKRRERRIQREGTAIIDNRASAPPAAPATESSAPSTDGVSSGADAVGATSGLRCLELFATP